MRERERERERTKYCKTLHSKDSLRLQFLIIIFLIFSFFLILDFVYTKYGIGRNLGIQHKVFHHHLLPNEKGIETDWVYPRTKVYTNSLGFRDFANRKINLKNKKRIVFIGDSFTFGSRVEYKFTVPGLAYDYFANKGIEVLNASVVSYSPSIYYNKIKFFIEQGLEFSHLVVFIDISDIEDEAGIYVTDDITQTIKSTLLEKETQIFQIKKFLVKNFKVSHYLWRFLRNKLTFNNVDELRFNNVNEYIDYVVSKKYKRDKWTIDEDIRKEYNLGIDKSIKYMTLLKDLLDKNNIKLTVVVYPWFTQIYHQDLNSIQVKIWKEFSEINNNQFINLFPYFINEENKNFNIYQKILLDFIPYDVHWNQHGSKKVFKNFIKYFKY
jgi:hypothetical protein